jgi:hypothetical protein
MLYRPFIFVKIYCNNKFNLLFPVKYPVIILCRFPLIHISATHCSFYSIIYNDNEVTPCKMTVTMKQKSGGRK